MAIFGRLIYFIYFPIKSNMIKMICRNLLRWRIEPTCNAYFPCIFVFTNKSDYGMMFLGNNYCVCFVFSYLNFIMFLFLTNMKYLLTWKNTLEELKEWVQFFIWNLVRGYELYVADNYTSFFTFTLLNIFTLVLIYIWFNRPRNQIMIPFFTRLLIYDTTSCVM